MKKLITTGIKKQIQTSLKNRKGEERPYREKMKKTPIIILKFTRERGIKEVFGEWKTDFPRRKDW
jgi:hypothetical protein